MSTRARADGQTLSRRCILSQAAQSIIDQAAQQLQITRSLRHLLFPHDPPSVFHRDSFVIPGSTVKGIIISFIHTSARCSLWSLVDIVWSLTSREKMHTCFATCWSTQCTWRARAPGPCKRQVASNRKMLFVNHVGDVDPALHATKRGASLIGHSIGIVQCLDIKRHITTSDLLLLLA